MKGIYVLAGILCLMIIFAFSANLRAEPVAQDEGSQEVTKSLTISDISIPHLLSSLRLKVQTRAEIRITNPDDGTTIFHKEFKQPGNQLSTSHIVYFPDGGTYHVEEHYFIEAMPDLPLPFPTFVIFRADPIFEWDAEVPCEGNYTLSLDATWNPDSSVEITGFISANPSPVTLSHLLDGGSVDIEIDWSQNDINVEFEGQIDKMTNIEGEEGCGSPGPISDHRPIIYEIEPDSGVKGQVVDVKITGANFLGISDPSQVSFGDGIEVCSVTFVDPCTIFVNIEISPDTEVGPRDVTLAKSDDCYYTAEGAFEVEGLRVDRVIPSVGAPGTTVDVIIVGAGFEDDSVVTIGDDITVNNVCLISEGQIKANITIPSDASAGPRDVCVENPDCDPTTLEDGFRVSGPTVLSILPTDDEGDRDGYLDISACEGDVLTLGIYLRTEECVNGIAAYLHYDPEVLTVIPYDGRHDPPFDPAGFFGDGSKVMENRSPCDGQLNYAEGAPGMGKDPEGFMAYFRVKVVHAPDDKVTVIDFDLDRENHRMTELSLHSGDCNDDGTVCGKDETLVPLTRGLRIHIIPPAEMFISGKVRLQSRVNHSAFVRFEIKKDGAVVWKDQIQTDEDGSYHLNGLCIPPGEYDVTAKAPGFLKGKVECVSIPAINVDFFLCGGDVQGGRDEYGDNDVDLKDFSKFARAFGKGMDDPGYIDICDLNGNGVVDLPDFAVLASNFGATGANSPMLMNPDIRLELEPMITEKPKVGDPVVISLKMVSAQSLYACAFQIAYDPTKLQFLGADEGEILKKAGPAVLHVKIEKPGLVTILGSLIGESKGIDGDGEIAKLNFRLLSGSSEIRLNDPAVITVVGLNDGAMVRLPSQSIALNAIPERMILGQNYPNPFNPETWIPFALSNPSDVVIRIFDSAGRIIRTIDLGMKEAGFYMDRGKAAYWDGRNDLGERVSSGVYFYQIQAGDFTATRRMLILK